MYREDGYASTIHQPHCYYLCSSGAGCLLLSSVPHQPDTCLNHLVKKMRTEKKAQHTMSRTMRKRDTPPTPLPLANVRPPERKRRI